jgi:hypothetical protein
MEFSDYSCRVILGFFGLKSRGVKCPFIYGSDYQDNNNNNNNDSHVIRAVFYRDVKSPSNFTMKQHFFI